MLLTRVATRLRVCVIVFTGEQLPLHSLLTTCECKHLQVPFLKRLLHESQNDCP